MVQHYCHAMCGLCTVDPDAEANLCPPYGPGFNMTDSDGDDTATTIATTTTTTTTATTTKLTTTAAADSATTIVDAGATSTALSTTEELGTSATDVTTMRNETSHAGCVYRPTNTAFQILLITFLCSLSILPSQPLMP